MLLLLEPASSAGGPKAVGDGLPATETAAAPGTCSCADGGGDARSTTRSGTLYAPNTAVLGRSQPSRPTHCAAADLRVQRLPTWPNRPRSSRRVIGSSPIGGATSSP